LSDDIGDLAAFRLNNDKNLATNGKLVTDLGNLTKMRTNELKNRFTVAILFGIGADFVFRYLIIEGLLHKYKENKKSVHDV
jgi:hypothetical protein